MREIENWTWMFELISGFAVMYFADIYSDDWVFNIKLIEMYEATRENNKTSHMCINIMKTEVEKL